MSDLLDRLRQVLGPTGVLVGDALEGRKAGPWANSGTIVAKAILRPRSTDQLAETMRLCHQAGQVVVPSGGLTGLVHGAQTGAEDILISLELMNGIEEIDPIGRTMTVQAGCVLQTLQEEADKIGLMFPLDLGARGSCTIGGNVSTNAGGNRVIRYGMTRDLVLGLEAVLPDGRVVSSLNKMIKNNAGFDLKHLFIGTEGTLGIVSRLVLRLREKPTSQNTAFVAIDEYAQVTGFLKAMDRSLGGSLSAFEVLWRDVYELLTTAPAKSRPPLAYGHRYYVLVESLGNDQDSDAARFEAALEQAFAEGLLADAVIARNLSERQAMWAIRDDVGQFQHYPPVFGFDVSLPIKDMERYTEQVRQSIAAQWEGGRTWVFGHLGDGNLHVVISAAAEDEAARSRLEDTVYRPLQEIGGSVSAEHGIGLDKKRHLSLSRQPEEIALMRSLKQMFDPKGILNPGKVIAVA